MTRSSGPFVNAKYAVQQLLSQACPPDSFVSPNPHPFLYQKYASGGFPKPTRVVFFVSIDSNRGAARAVYGMLHASIIRHVTSLIFAVFQAQATNDAQNHRVKSDEGDSQT